MSRSLLLRVAAVLSLVTAVAHTIGTFMPIPPEQTQMHATVATMKATMIPMPVGAAKSYMQVLDGNNICTSFFLLLCAALLFSVAKADRSAVVERVVLLTALALAAISIISFVYFFPIPGVFTGVAALLAVWTRFRGAAAS